MTDMPRLFLGNITRHGHGIPFTPNPQTHVLLPGPAERTGHPLEGYSHVTGLLGRNCTVHARRNTPLTARAARLRLTAHAGLNGLLLAPLSLEPQVRALDVPNVTYLDLDVFTDPGRADDLLALHRRAASRWPAGTYPDAPVRGKPWTRFLIQEALGGADAIPLSGTHHLEVAFTPGADATDPGSVLMRQALRQVLIAWRAERNQTDQDEVAERQVLVHADLADWTTTSEDREVLNIDLTLLIQPGPHDRPFGMAALHVGSLTQAAALLAPHQDARRFPVLASPRDLSPDELRAFLRTAADGAQPLHLPGRAARLNPWWERLTPWRRAARQTRTLERHVTALQQVPDDALLYAGRELHLLTVAGPDASHTTVFGVDATIRRALNELNGVAEEWTKRPHRQGGRQTRVLPSRAGGV